MRLLLFKLLLPFITLIGVVRPFYGLCVYISFNILRPEMFFWGGRSANIIFKVTIISTFLGWLRLRPNPRRLVSYSDFWLFLWLWGACAISLIMSDYSLEPKAWYYCTEIFKLWILVFVILGLAYKKEHLIKLEYVSLIAISLLSLWGIEQHFRGNSRLEGIGGQAFGDSNSLAAVAVLYFPIALNYALTAKNKKWKFVWFFSVACIATLIIFTQSRGGFLGLIAGVLYLFFRTRKKKTLLVVCTTVVLVCAPFLAQDYTNRLTTIGQGSQDRDVSAGSRLVLWQAGVLMFVDNPIFGVGLLNFAKAKIIYKDHLSGNFDQDLLDYSFRDYKVGHSTYFTQLLAEGGLVLAIPYFWLIGGFLLRGLGVRKRERVDKDSALLDLLAGIEAGVVGHCISIMFINALFLYFLPLQLVIGRQIIRALKEK